MYIFVRLFCWMIILAIFLFVVVSTVLFIKDGIRAKREGTGRKIYIIVMFVISMTIVALVAVIWMLLYILGMLIMRSM